MERRYLSTNEEGHLVFGGCDTVELVKKYNTPLYVMDEMEIRQRCREIKECFDCVDSKILYASKAFSCKGIYEILKEEGLGVDVASMGEMYVALSGGYPSENMYFHGNNKTKEELEYALNNDIGCIIVDNFYEIENLDFLTNELNKTVNVMLRISPGVEGHTHEAISTGQLDSKFGFPIEFGIALKAVERVLDTKKLNLIGIHCHIGSQMFSTDVYKIGAERMVDLACEIKTVYDFQIKELNIGGGFGVYYTDEDEPKDITDFAKIIIGEIKSNCKKNDFKLPTIIVEPGRWLVGEAGLTLYTIGSIKEIPGIRKYISVDGGMTDNIRPALYQAKYEGVIANKYNEPRSEVVTVAGKCCESGDKLITDMDIATVESGDTLAIFTTGAYNYTMSSNYNKAKKPAVVFVKNGESRLVVKRESLEDLVRNDV